MTAGLVAAYDAVEIFAAMTAAYAASPGSGVNLTAGLITYYCPNGTDQDPFVNISFAGTVLASTGAASGSTTLAIPPLGIAETITYTSFPASASAGVTIADFRLYQQDEQWFCTWSGITVKIDSTTWSFASGNLTSPRLAPTGVPFLGIPPTLSALVMPATPLAIPIGPITGGTTPFSDSSSASAHCTGGYHVKELGASAFTAFPVTLDMLIGNQTGCPCEPDTIPALSASDTASGSVTSGFTQLLRCVDDGPVSCTECTTGPAIVPAVIEVFTTTESQETWSSSVTLLPDLPKSVKRFRPDYAALIFRGGLPKTTASYFDVCHDAITGTETGNVQLSSNPNPSETAFLATIGNAPHIIETPFTTSTNAPYTWVAENIFEQSFNGVLVSPGVCPGLDGTIDFGQCFDGSPTACYSMRGSRFPSGVDDIHANPQLTPGLYHGNPLPRLIDYWSAPHWNYAYWFPPDATGSLKPYEWPVDGNRANPSAYWLPLGSQWLWNPALPSGDARKTRTDLISAPLASGGLAGFWPGFFGSGNLVSPWGICRFIAQNVALPASVQLTQVETAGWTFANCGASFGSSSITLTPTGAPATCTATYDLGEFGADPRMLPLLLASVVAASSGAGVSSTAANMVGIDGSLAPLTGGGTATKYAGSWGRDFSCGYAASDTGADLLANGISATELAAAETTYAFELLPGFTAAKLQFVFTLSDPSHTVTLDYPTFNLPTGSPTVIPEGRANHAILFPNGPGVRFGSWDWWDYVGAAWQDPPSVYPVGKTSRALDWLAFKRVALQGIAAESGLDTEIASLYDSVEGQTRAQLSAGTNGFITVANGKLTGIMVSSLAEVPPLAIFPRKARDANLQPTGSYALESWSHAQEGRYLIGQVAADLFTPGGVQWTTIGGPTVPGWEIRRHAHPVDNTEDATFLVKSGGTSYATASPWHGYFCLLIPPGGASPWNVESEFGELHMAYVNSGDIVYRWSPFTVPRWQITTAVTSDGGWSSPRMCLDHRGRIELRAVKGAHAYRMVSDDNGATWGPLVSGVLTPELVV